MTPDRRSFLTHAGLAALAVGTGALSGCGPTRSASTGAAPTGSSFSVDAASVPVGGGTILTQANWVVTQPTEGEFRAFSKFCTHQGCPVSDIQGSEIHCRCHGARFSIEDGSVTKGPATKPLTSATAVLDGDQVTITA